ncbi:MAG: hypothetical protein ACI915_001647, partial [Gammaproteobacteria bacterium]
LHCFPSGGALLVGCSALTTELINKDHPSSIT